MNDSNRVFGRLMAKVIPKSDLDKIGGAGLTPTKAAPTTSINFQTGFERIDDTGAEYGW